MGRMPTNGDVPVSYGMLSGGFQGTYQTVDMMRKIATGKWGSRSPKIRALAIDILRRAGIKDKDYLGEMVAIHNWVRDQNRYTRDVAGQETLCHPEEVAFNSRAGDCLDGDTLLLTPSGFKAIKEIRKGDIIQGKKGWTHVTAWWDKGTLPVRTYFLDNGGSFTATDDHRCFRLDGTESSAKALKKGEALLGPAPVIACGPSDRLTERDCFFLGIFLADGWVDGNRVCIAGKDGFAKEEQKRWVKDYAEGRGWKTSWHPRYIRVYIPKDEWMSHLFTKGEVAPEKQIPSDVLKCLTPAKVERLLQGLMSDSHHPMETKRALDAVSHRKRVRRSGTCYSTVSEELAKQVRMLFRYTGVSVRVTKVIDHGGLGKHPVYRIYPRFYLPKPARIDQIEDVGARHVFDIETEDKGIYLPDADIVVHNCDDLSMLEAALLGAIGIPTRFVTIGVTPEQFSHVYLMARPKQNWIPLDPIMKGKPAGWEAPPSTAKIKKVYPDNVPEDAIMSTTNGLGYVGDPRVFSHLDEEPAAEAAPPAYVRMDSMLDADEPTAAICAQRPAFPQQTYDARYPGKAAPVGPKLVDRRTMSPQAVADRVRADNARLVESEAAGMMGYQLSGENGLLGPDALGAMAFNPDRQGNGKRMQRPGIAASPEGVDNMFTRKQMVMRPQAGDRVLYKGLYALNERPPIVRVNGVAGLGADDAPVPNEVAPAVVVMPQPSQTPKLVGIALVAFGAYLFFTRKKK